MELKTRGIVFGAGLAGGALGALIGAVLAGGLVNTASAALLCAATAIAGVFPSAPSAPSSPARRARRPDQIPHQRRGGHVGGQDALSW